MSFARFPRSAACILALLVWGVPAARSQPCPASTIEFLPPGPDPVSSTTAARNLYWSWELGRGQGAYDLVAGTLSAGSIGDPQGGFGAHVRSNDVYQLIGPGPGVVSFSVRLYVSGTAHGRNDGYLPTDQGYVTIAAALIEAGGSSDSTSLTSPPGQTLPLDEALEIPLAHSVGDPFRLITGVHSQGGFSDGDIRGILSFIMPPGYAVISCQNFLGSGATRTELASWGRLKALYR